jgi:hypothetical protein
VRTVALVALLVSVAVAPAAAEAPPTARSVGRAGAGLVSDDGLGAVLTNPAAMARRDGWRAQAGVLVVDDDATIAADRADGADGVARGAPTLAPMLGAQFGLGPLVLGLAWHTERGGRTLPAPQADQPEDDVARLFGYRYGGISAGLRRDTLAVAAAARVGDWLALGVSATAARVELTERRRLWAGFAGREPVGAPARDVDVALAGTDTLVPGATFGAFIAPATLPVELAAAVGWANAATVRGTAQLAPARTDELTVEVTDITADRIVPSATTASVGARTLGERFAVEAEVAAAWFADRPAPWRLLGATVVDRTGVSAALPALPSRWSTRDHVSARAAAELEIVPGLAWLTVGYAWRGAASDPRVAAASTMASHGHTVAAGLDLTTGGVTLSLGYARTLATTQLTSRTSLGLDNPFAAGDAPVGLGALTTSRDLVGVNLELAAD